MTSSWMLVAGFLFAAVGVCVKIGSAQFDSTELGFYRSFVTLLSVGVILAIRRTPIRTPYMGTHIVRGTMGALSIIGYFYAITQLPLATAQTLNYTSPIFLAIATVVVMGERFSRWLVAAIILGFVGVALLLQPTFESGKEGAALIGLFSGVLASWAYLSVRTLGRLGEPDERVVFWFGLTASLICAGWQLATSSFHAVRWDNVWILVAIGLGGMTAQLAMTRAYRTGNTLVVGSLSYSTLVFGAIFTFLLWDDRLSALEWAGMGIIILSGIAAMRVEKKEQVEEAGFES